MIPKRGAGTAAGGPPAPIRRQPGELFWKEGETDLRPLRIRQGVVAYRRGNAAIGLLGPGQVAVPVPGSRESGPALADLVALVETTVVPIDPNGSTLSEAELRESILAVIRAAEQLGNLSLPQRLANLLLDVTDMTGQPVVGCRQDLLAMATAARRETVAAILSGWRDEDWVQTRYRRCKVLNRDALERIRWKTETAS